MPSRVANIFRLFIASTSLRGFAKLARPDQRPFLRLLWAAFILSMLCVLCLSCYSLVFEYFQYHVSQQTDQLVKHPSPFPSVTICSHQPFSRRAIGLWSNGTAPSPANFSSRVRSVMRDLLARGRYQDAREVFQSDRLSGYYQSLERDQIALLGHEQSDLLLFCVMRHSHNTNPSVAHEDSCEHLVRRIQHPLYFNCFTLEVAKDPNYVSSVSMVISGGGQIENGLSDQVYNLFDQAAGLVIVLHEPGTYPDTDAEQYRVQLGTASTIRYTTERYVRYQSPKTDCMHSDEMATAAPRITQNGEIDFHYTQSACIAQQISQFIAQHCNCTSAFHLNPRPPDVSQPFCSRLPEGDGVAAADVMLARIACARNISLERVYSEPGDDTSCRQRCVRWRYSVEQSNSDWRPLGSQLHWMKRVTAILSSESEATPEDAKLLNEFFTDGADGNWTDARSASDEGMAMVTIVRETFVTKQQSEKPVISLSALVSRLGGIGTLTLGVTLTFAFEIVELFYLALAEALCGRNSDRHVDETDEDAARADGLLSVIRSEGLAVKTVFGETGNSEAKRHAQNDDEADIPL